MKVFAVDPGAKRCGWAVITKEEKKPVEYVGSGIFGLHRSDNEKYQPYRVRLIESWVEWADELFVKHKPDALVAEIVPAVGGGNFVVAAQSQLASTVSVVLMTVAFQKNIEVHQISANKVKKQIGGVKDATKPKVRDGVYKILPKFKEAYQDNKSGVWDEIDALAVGLAFLKVKHEN